MWRSRTRRCDRTREEFAGCRIDGGCSGLCCGLDDVLEDESPTPERHLAQKDDGRVVQAALDKLSERQRTVIVLAHFQELGQAEAADIMGSASTPMNHCWPGRGAVCARS